MKQNNEEEFRNEFEELGINIKIKGIKMLDENSFECTLDELKGITYKYDDFTNKFINWTIASNNSDASENGSTKENESNKESTSKSNFLKKIKLIAGRRIVKLLKTGPKNEKIEGVAFLDDFSRFENEDVVKSKSLNEIIAPREAKAPKEQIYTYGNFDPDEKNLEAFFLVFDDEDSSNKKIVVKCFNDIENDKFSKLRGDMIVGFENDQCKVFSSNSLSLADCYFDSSKSFICISESVNDFTFKYILVSDKFLIHALNLTDKYQITLEPVLIKWGFKKRSRIFKFQKGEKSPFFPILLKFVDKEDANLKHPIDSFINYFLSNNNRGSLEENKKPAKSEAKELFLLPYFNVDSSKIINIRYLQDASSGPAQFHRDPNKSSDTKFTKWRKKIHNTFFNILKTKKMVHRQARAIFKPINVVELKYNDEVEAIEDRLNDINKTTVPFVIIKSINDLRINKFASKTTDLSIKFFFQGKKFTLELDEDTFANDSEAINLNTNISLTGSPQQFQSRFQFERLVINDQYVDLNFIEYFYNSINFLDSNEIKLEQNLRVVTLEPSFLEEIEPNTKKVIVGSLDLCYGFTDLGGISSLQKSGQDTLIDKEVHGILTCYVKGMEPVIDRGNIEVKNINPEVQQYSFTIPSHSLDDLQLDFVNTSLIFEPLNLRKASLLIENKSCNIVEFFNSTELSRQGYNKKFSLKPISCESEILIRKEGGDNYVAIANLILSDLPFSTFRQTSCECNWFRWTVVPFFMLVVIALKLYDSKILIVSK